MVRLHVAGTESAEGIAMVKSSLVPSTAELTINTITFTQCNSVKMSNEASVSVLFVNIRQRKLAYQLLVLVYSLLLIPSFGFAMLLAVTLCICLEIFNDKLEALHVIYVTIPATCVVWICRFFREAHHSQTWLSP
ncbi:hypothetical protein GQ44DRAFT_704161 [Phaeosphaeriaceae sp. PMI808]|nr:hypothetical protein GQ44DRAFT_704161 [Phaeosphaeriaceae sp. PMI808]